MAEWKLNPDYQNLHNSLGSLEAVFALKGERITKDRVSEVVRVEIEGTRYYVKRYWDAGKGIRKFLGKPRIKREWQNMQRFKKWGIATAEVVASGLERSKGLFIRGAMVTKEIPNTIDLSQMVEQQDARLHDYKWVNNISLQLAKATRRMHDHNFAHNDLKWRNLLVDDQQNLFFIDCPTGAFWYGYMFSFRRIKDLACLDKVAKYQLTRTQRLRFYLQYRERDRLKDKDKQRIRRIVRLYEGRE